MKARRLLTILLAAIMVFSAVAFTVSAAGDRKTGDVNGDGRINVGDFTLVKRHVLGTYKLNDEQKVGADINKDNKINTADYMLLKRHVLGTYKIPDGSTTEQTAIEKITAAIGKKDKISINYEGAIATFHGNAVISFEMIGGVLNLHGHAITDEGIEIDLLIPMAKIEKTYTFSGDAKMTLGNQTLTGEASGSMVAATYTVDESTFKDLKITSSIALDSMQEKVLKQLCKEAMDQFLFQANNLLKQEKIDATIADLGFTQFYKDIQDGLMDL